MNLYTVLLKIFDIDESKLPVLHHSFIFNSIRMKYNIDFFTHPKLDNPRYVRTLFGFIMEQINKKIVRKTI